MSRGQLRDAAGVHDVPERAVRRVEQRRLGAHGDFLDGAADFERDLELETIGDADVDRFADPFLEA